MSSSTRTRLLATLDSEQHPLAGPLVSSSASLVQRISVIDPGDRHTNCLAHISGYKPLLSLFKMSHSPTATPPAFPDPGPSTSSHLSYPAAEPSAPVGSTPASGSHFKSRQVLKDRLYVGNLHSTVDEYTLIQLFSKYGKLANLDYLYHKSGPMKGKPRGYAFVEFVDASDAEKALSATHDKLLRGRRLHVTHAHQAPLDASGSGYKRMVNEAGRPTALSLLKSGTKSKTQDKIALMEAKLRQLEDEKEKHQARSSEAPSLPTPHPSLPVKPSAQVQALSNTPPAPVSSSGTAQGTRPLTRPKGPPGPMSHHPSHPPPVDLSQGLGLGKAPLAGKRSGGTGVPLKGVKIVKKKIVEKTETKPDGAGES